jgi:hypothetical protein
MKQGSCVIEGVTMNRTNVEPLDEARNQCEKEAQNYSMTSEPHDEP